MSSDEQPRSMMGRVRAALDERTSGIVVSPPPFDTILARAQGHPPTPPTAPPLSLPAVASGPGGAVASGDTGGSSRAAGTGAESSGAAARPTSGAGGLPEASFVPVRSLGSTPAIARRTDAPSPANAPAAGGADGGRGGVSLVVKLLVPAVAVAALVVFVVLRGGDEPDSTGESAPASEVPRDIAEPDVDPDPGEVADGVAGEQPADEQETPDAAGGEPEDERGAPADVGDESAEDTVVDVADTEPATEPADEPSPDERLQRRAEAFVNSLVDVDADAHETFFGPQCDEERSNLILDDFDRYADMWAGFRPRITSFISGPDSGTANLVYFIEEQGGDVGSSLPWLLVDDEWFPETCDVNATVFGAGG